MPQTNLIQKLVGRVITPIWNKKFRAGHRKKRTKVLFQEFLLAGYPYHRADGVWPFLRIGELLHLQREPYNRYDPNAIAVYFKNDMLGYIPSSENSLLAQMMDRGERLEVRITQLLSDLKPWRGVRFSVFLGSKGYELHP